MISIHAPAKGATYVAWETTNTTGFQSTLPRRERLIVFRDPELRQSISIHAPAKGATSKDFFHGVVIVISIHAPAKGAT